MNWVRALCWLLPRRVRSSWVLVAITSFGILAAVTLMSLGALYSRALAEGGLRHTLASTSRTSLNATVTVPNRPLGPADYTRLRSAVEGAIDPRLGSMHRETHRSGRAPRNLPIVRSRESMPSPFPATLGQPFFLNGFQEHSRLLAGSWPSPTAVMLDDGVGVEAVLGAPVATAMGLSVGDTAYIVPFPDDRVERLELKVVGLAEAVDSREEYWMSASSSYFNPVDLGNTMLAPIYVPETAFLDGIGARYPSLVGDYSWMLYLDTDMITASNVGGTKDAVTGLQTDIAKQFPRSLLLTGLENTLTDYEKELTHARVPIFLFISMVVVVILYLLVLVTGTLASIRGGEASLLRSRGASPLQMSGLLALGEGAVVLVAVVVGPFLALALARYLLLDTVNPVAGGDPVSVGLSADMFILGAVGGLLSLAVLTASGLGLARMGMVEFLRARARPPTVPLLQRYYADIGVLVAVGFIFWQIQDRGGFVEGEVLGRSLEAHPALLLGPVLVMVAAAFLMLRLLPLVLRALGWAGGLFPAWVSFALVRVARDPIPHGTLAIMLLMAATLGAFGATFQSTLSRGQREQALYDVGGDLVINDPVRSSATREAVAGVPGIRSLSPVGRHSVSVENAFPGISTTLLAVDPNTLDDVAWFRNDFAGKSLSQLMAPLRGSPGDPNPGIVLPVDAGSVGVWARSDDAISLWARLFDSRGTYRSLLLGDIPASLPRASGRNDPGDWMYLEAALPPAEGPFEPPLSVVSFFVGGGLGFRNQPGSVALDDVTVKGPSTPVGGTVIEGFEEPGPWAPMARASVEFGPRAAMTGRSGLGFSWEERSGGESIGALVPPGPYPLPAIGGPMYRREQLLDVGSGGRTVPVVVSDVTRYFPTIDPAAVPFLLVSLSDYQEHIRRLPRGRPVGPDEFWASVEDSAERSEVIGAIRERVSFLVSVEDRDARVDQAQRDPLGGGGWNGLTILSIAALTVAVALALGTHAIASLRSGRIDLTVARALGLSRRQMILSLALEKAVVAVLALAAGGVLGVWLGRWVLGFLDLTASGRPLVPPLVVTFHDGLMALVFAGLVAALVAATLLAALSAARLRASDVLRAGQ